MEMYKQVMLFGIFKEHGEGMVSTETLEKVWAGRRAEETQHLEGGYLVHFTAQSSSSMVLYVYVH